MNTPDCIKTRRSVRVFQDTPIPRQTMEQIVALASYAPSWKNTQVARYLVVDRREEIQAIAQTYATFNSRILSTCTALVALTALKHRSGYERDGSFSTDRGDGWTMFAVSYTHLDVYKRQAKPSKMGLLAVSTTTMAASTGIFPSWIRVWRVIMWAMWPGKVSWQMRDFKSS